MKKLLTILFFIIFCCSIVAGVYFLQKEDSGKPALNDIDLNIAQYSARNITENAIVKNEKFSHISFAEPRIEERNLFKEQLASVWSIFLSLFYSESKINKEINQINKRIYREEYGTWIWTPTLSLTKEYMQSTLDDLKKEGVNTVYLSIDSYLDIYTLPESAQKTEQKDKFSIILEEFISLAKERSIEVDAEAGWQNWAEEGHTYKAFAIVDFVKDFNETHTNKFRGFQYDVEPYMLDSYRASSEGKREALTKFTKLIDQTAEYLINSDLSFSIVVPDFFDKGDGKTPEFTYSDRKDYAFKQLLHVLEKKPGSSILVMSYRNFAHGRDGSIDVSKNEMKTVEKGRFNSNIILAEETGDVPPPYITFHATSKDYFKEETSKLRSAFISHPNFGGIAIHYANAFISLK